MSLLGTEILYYQRGHCKHFLLLCQTRSVLTMTTSFTSTGDTLVPELQKNQKSLDGQRASYFLNIP